MGDIEHVDVLIVGAGISGIGSAYHLTRQSPDRSFVILENYESFGGTWWMHRYPGVRSDSDLYTFGYRFKPWTGAPIATAEQIRSYLGEVIDENGLEAHIRYNHHITAASWDDSTRLWTITATDRSADQIRVFTAGFLWMCQGYYRHASGYTPEWPGMSDFEGTIVHPQTWPDDLDYTGKRVAVIGSGATAATLIPAIADRTAHTTMIQRSPTYFFPGQNANELADTLRSLDIPEEWTHEIVRRKSLADQEMIVRMAAEYPDLVKEELIKGVRDQLPEGFDVDTHFTPSYRPWQQRIAFVPDGDLFKGISSGKASVVTGNIERFTPTGVLMTSGEEVEADIVVTATGFDLSVLGDIAFTVDGRPLDFHECITYRGMMFTGLPNLVWVFGYFRASWTLRADLIGDFTCRLLNRMADIGATKVEPVLRAEDADMPILDWIDPENFNPNYLRRSMHLLPKRGDKPEWMHTQDYWLEKEQLPNASLDDGCLRFS